MQNIFCFLFFFSLSEFKKKKKIQNLFFYVFPLIHLNVLILVKLILWSHIIKFFIHIFRIFSAICKTFSIFFFLFLYVNKFIKKTEIKYMGVCEKKHNQVH